MSMIMSNNLGCAALRTLRRICPMTSRQHIASSSTYLSSQSHSLNNTFNNFNNRHITTSTSTSTSTSTYTSSQTRQYSSFRNRQSSNNTTQQQQQQQQQNGNDEDISMDTLTCSAICLSKSFKKELHSLPDNFSLEKVFHVSNVRWLRYNGGEKGGDAFVFPSFGCVISWGIPEDAQRTLLTWLKEYEVEGNQPPQLDSYVYTDGGSRFEITKSREIITLSADPAANLNEKFAVSYAFAQSVRLFLIEDDVIKLSEKVAQLPDELSKHGTVRISKKEIGKQLGEQMKIKNYLNLHSDIIDTPEHFWEHTEGEGIYKIVRSHCEIDKRVRIMNERLNLISGIYDVINDEQKHSHSIRLERIIIALIAIEGTSGILHWFY
ncbi:hypothetical protein SAMD00019534_117650 [Acytostelium subglobosum LB1]|uniref:hypothetical protein n=1 Tax=Acytostelium subglobosum LB1 TaxID=1410327 RepID=UPI000644E6D8|nr:hypothetical protein SAMD00019534_117650 [Acytostelium subglobosum LB1]GAM28589.1 hypothetical protein SAMD00019534_117650 [Acytostelium subglobosum LB1]|eukprot:XP_012748367.1 hypothetical protein SAMD00019534_117650 [Acytostelium subglobosum LB1]